MIIGNNLPIFLWDEAVAYATFIRNRSPTRALKGKTPHEAWTGKKPDVTFLREFGLEVWVPDESRNRSKLEAKAKKVIFVGIMEGSKAIRYWDKGGRAIRVSRNFTFSENGELKELQVTEIPGLEAEGEDTMDPASQTAPENVGTIPKPQIHEIPDINTRELQTRDTKINYKRLNEGKQSKPTTRKPITSEEPKIAKPSRIEEQANLAFEQFIMEEKEYGYLAEEDCLKTVNDAIRSDEGEKWKKAMEEEMETLKRMG